MTMAKHLEALRLAVGDATLAGARAELMLGGLIVGLAETNDLRVLGKPGRPMGSLIEQSRNLLAERDDLDPHRDEASALLDALSTVKDKRNRLVHDAVAVHPLQDGETAPRFVRLPTAWGPPGKSEPIEVSDLQMVATELERISMAIVTWSYMHLPYTRA